MNNCINLFVYIRKISYLLIKCAGQEDINMIGLYIRLSIVLVSTLILNSVHPDNIPTRVELFRNLMFHLQKNQKPSNNNCNARWS